MHGWICLVSILCGETFDMNYLDAIFTHIKNNICDNDIPKDHIIHIWHMGLAEYKKELEEKGLTYENSGN